MFGRKHRIFDSPAQAAEFRRVVEQEREKAGTKRIGLFGSRERGDQIAGKSDIDVMVEREGAPNVGVYEYRGSRRDINVVTVPPTVEGESTNSKFLNGIKGKTRWLRGSGRESE